MLNYYIQKNVNSHTFGVLAEGLKMISKICCSNILGYLHMIIKTVLIIIPVQAKP